MYGVNTDLLNMYIPTIQRLNIKVLNFSVTVGPWLHRVDGDINLRWRTLSNFREVIFMQKFPSYTTTYQLHIHFDPLHTIGDLIKHCQNSAQVKRVTL